MAAKGAAVVCFTVASAVALMLVLIFSGLSAAGAGIFNSTIGNVSAKYETDITPADFTFSIWSLIYFWQVSWIIYALSTIFRTNEKGRVILNPVVLPVRFHVFWITSCLLTVAWLFVWDRQQLLAAFIVLLLQTLSGYAATAFQGIATTDSEEQLKRESKGDLIAIYILVQNGTDLFFSWTTVATMVNLSIALTYSPDVAGNWSSQDSSTLALVILLVLVLGWSVAENTVFYKFFHFVYAWYAVLIWASAGILVKNYDPSNPNSILTIVIIIVALICLCLKIVVYLFRTRASAKYSKVVLEE